MSLSTETIPVIDAIAPLGKGYAAWLVDIWGVMHNGVRAFPPAVEATRRYREQGGIVILLSNSPRPSEPLQRQLTSLGVSEESYDATVSSGDLTRHELAKHEGARIFHLGPERDLPIFKDLDLTRVDAKDAELVVCTGLFNDETETPEDYEVLLRELAGRKLTMLCANPDHLVERGHSLVYCAGALAQIYEEDGGEVIYAGKPYLRSTSLPRRRSRASPGERWREARSSPSATASAPTWLERLSSGSMRCSWRAGSMSDPAARGSTTFVSPSCSRAAKPRVPPCRRLPGSSTRPRNP